MTGTTTVWVRCFKCRERIQDIVIDKRVRFFDIRCLCGANIRVTKPADGEIPTVWKGTFD